ncbi:translation initiation factor 3, subunit F [Guillardia theta CCMP2712]|uniref:Translation initiation factor 3, subunit F n=2 Tax=Guillardia theta TaxID=55529 RepID=L1I715_GUITC|nr:translation initiation factor 3, subunit F [Guillardia theta CCMP2712]EKX31660.1 translation initiation factor 3, subunit F [Guillardia theta CCMP2712]|eukprot:XP_005818640.1 translation initiation factor 3, subunit F [Guillardia theta CCMP2712]
MEPGFLQLSTPSATHCHLHPLVMFQVLDHHTRRNDETGRVVGALLGSANADGSVAIRNSFPMNHDDVTHQDFGLFFNTMEALHQKVNAREHVVGWYTTTKSTDDDKDEVGEEDVALHSFFEEKVGEKHACVLVRVDCNIQRASKLGVSAFTSSNMSLRSDKTAPELVLGKCFSRVTCHIRAYEAERIGVDFITHNTIGQGGGEVLGTDLEKLESSMHKLMMMIDQSIQHVDDVLDGNVEADTKVGRALAETIAMVPEMSAAEFDTSFSKGLQDILMVQYLAAVTQAQISFWQKLQSMGA